MIEKVLRDYLADMLDVPVYLVQPEPGSRPASYVFIEKTGSGEDDMILTSTLAVQSYAESHAAAALLNIAVKSCMELMPAMTDEVTAVRLNSDYNFTDTGTKLPRYQAVYDITHYGEE